MITIIFDTDPNSYRASLIVDGHANFDDFGKDIVCASVSILTYTIAKVIDDNKSFGKIAENSVIRLDNGKAFINAHCMGKEAYIDVLGHFETVLTGYKLIAEEYPQNVVVKT